MKKGLFIRQIELKREDISFDEYPFNIEVIKNFHKIELTSPVTFFVGENGIGKSTFIEALAVALGLNAEGGTQNFNFSTCKTHSNLWEYLYVKKENIPRTMFFLRAESFYNVITEINNLGVKGYGGNLHNCSHGESFLQLVENRFTPNGLYILDEPEAALSPDRQLTLLYLIDELVKHGSQFIIATHSPILIGYQRGKILDFNNNFEEIEYKDTDIYQTYKMFLDNPYGVQKNLFDD